MLYSKPAYQSYFCFILVISKTLLAHIALLFRVVYCHNSVTPQQCTHVQITIEAFHVQVQDVFGV